MQARDRNLAWAIMLAGMAAAPFLLPTANATELLIFGLVAVAAYLLIGVGGLFSFGQAALFGIGGYVGGWLLANTEQPLVVPLLAGGAAAAAFGAVMGWLCVRRGGIYFIMLTFAFNQMVYYLAYTWRDVTGGEDGLAGILRPTSLVPGVRLNLDDPLTFYAVTAVIVLLSFLALWRVAASPLGRILVAARENPRRTASIGYDYYNAQTLAFAISGFFSGMAGVLYAMVYWIMPIDSVHWLNSGYIVFMVLIGGTSSMFGPMIGATIFILLQDFFSMLWARWPLLFGAVVIAVVLFVQGGVVELIGRVRDWLRRRAAARAEGRP